MRAFIKHDLVYWGIIMVISFLFLYSCSSPGITRYLNSPQWIEIEKVSDDILELSWESTEDVQQYVVYKIFYSKSGGKYAPRYELESYASKYEIARTTVPHYQYQGSYDPADGGYSSYIYACFFGVRVMDENGNMSRVEVIEVPQQ